MADDFIRGLLPRGVVSITVTRLLGLGSAPRPASGTAIYAAITVDGRFLGRSVPFSGVDSLDLAGLFEHSVIPTGERVLARIDGIDPGLCDVRFPSIDGREWGTTPFARS